LSFLSNADHFQTSEIGGGIQTDLLPLEYQRRRPKLGGERKVRFWTNSDESRRNPVTDEMATYDPVTEILISRGVAKKRTNLQTDRTSCQYHERTATWFCPFAL